MHIHEEFFRIPQTTNFDENSSFFDKVGSDADIFVLRNGGKYNAYPLDQNLR